MARHSLVSRVFPVHQEPQHCGVAVDLQVSLLTDTQHYLVQNISCIFASVMPLILQMTSAGSPSLSHAKTV